MFFVHGQGPDEWTIVNALEARRVGAVLIVNTLEEGKRRLSNVCICGHPVCQGSA